MVVIPVVNGLTLGDYRHGELSEFSERDLGRLAAGEQRTLFYDYFHGELLPAVSNAVRVCWLCPSIIAIKCCQPLNWPDYCAAASLGCRWWPGVA